MWLAFLPFTYGFSANACFFSSAVIILDETFFDDNIPVLIIILRLSQDYHIWDDLSPPPCEADSDKLSSFNLLPK
jgi:hypothetical protein